MLLELFFGKTGLLSRLKLLLAAENASIPYYRLLEQRKKSCKATSNICAHQTRSLKVAHGEAVFFLSCVVFRCDLYSG